MSELDRIDFANILSIDPGGTTGIAMQIVSPDAQQRLVRTATTDTPEQLYDLVAQYKWDAVICERFATAGRMSHYGLYTVELVGGVKALCYAYGMHFTYRQPQNRKAFQDVAHSQLTAEGKAFVVHQEDALAHLLSWKAVQRKLLTLSDLAEKEAKEATADAT